MSKLKLALITGATKGIGRATAITFANAGWDLILIARNIDMLQELSNREYLLSIATSGSRAMLKSMFSSYDIEKFFSITCTADEYAAKPSPDMLNFIVSSLSVDKRRSLMVGDSVNDIYAANNAGISAVGVTSGVGSGDYLSSAGAIEVVDDIRDLLQII